MIAGSSQMYCATDDIFELLVDFFAQSHDSFLPF